MKRIAFYIILTLAAIAFLYPFLWMINASFSAERSIEHIRLWPVDFTLDHYRRLFSGIPILRAFINSILVSSLVTMGVLVFCSMTGYALARHQFRGRNLLFYFLIFTMTLPFQLTLIPNYILMVKLGLTNTVGALVIPGLLNAMAILLFRQHFLTIPQDLIDAARMDGCSEWRILFQILWPISIPTLITVGIITFMATWNDVLWPIIVMRDEEWMTMPQLVTLYAVGGRSMGQIGIKLASATLLAAPIMMAYIFFQRYFIQSLATSGQKE